MFKVNRLPGNVVKRHYDHLSSSFNREHALITPASLAMLPGYSGELIEYCGDNLKPLLSGTPADLDALIEHIDTSYAEFSEYLGKRPNKRSKAWSLPMEQLIEIIERLFNYDYFSKDNIWGAYNLVKAYGMRLCPYCQLHHINYHGSGVRGGFSLRPPLDHFLPASRYPYLSVSLSNLIPSCYQCNSSIKGAKNPRENIPHPLDDCPVSIRFEVSLTSINLDALDPEDLDLKLPAVGDGAAHRDFFRLQERYQWYKPELCDLFGRHAKLRQLDQVWQEAIVPEIFVLGFSRDAASSRALGHCLLSVATSKGLV